MDRQVRHGHDLRVMPALLGIVVHEEHVVGEYCAEAQLPGVLRLGPGRTGPGNLDFHFIAPFV